MTEVELRPATETPPAPVAQPPAAQGADAAVPSVEERIKDLENRLSERGRSEKALKSELDTLRVERDELKTNNDKFSEWWHGPEGPAKPDEKVKFQSEKTAEQQSAPKLQQERSRSDLLEAIVAADDPTVKKALNGLYAKGKSTGKFPDRSTVEALVESLKPSDDGADDEEPQPGTKKEPPKVGAARSSRSVEVPIEVRIAEQEKLIKAGKASPSSIMGLEFERQQQQKLAKT